MPKAPTEYTVDKETEEESSISFSSNVFDYQSGEVIHADLSDFIGDLVLMEGQAEYLLSTLQ